MNRTTTIALVAVFGLLALYVLLVQAPRQRAEAEATPAASTITYLLNASGDQVRVLRVEEMDTQRSVALRQDDAGQWTLTEPVTEPADFFSASSAASQATTLFVNTTLTGTTDLTAYGLTAPAYALDLTLADGTRLRALVGDKTPTGTGYYALREGEVHAVVVASAGIDVLIRLLDAPPLVPTELPAIIEETPEADILPTAAP